MAHDWRPSALGRLLTRSSHWWFQLDGEHAEISINGNRYRAFLDEARRIQVVPGVLWSRVEVDLDGGPWLALDGLPNAQGADLSTTIKALLFERHQRERKALFDAIVELINSWLRSARALISEGDAGRRWITHEQQQSMLAQRPDLPLESSKLEQLYVDEDVHDDLRSPSHLEAVDDLRQWKMDWPALWKDANKSMATRELTLAKNFLDRVERKALNKEQAQAVICFDNRVQVVASAGSGKTSTMVAKAAYAITRGFIEPQRIVMLAFNKDAATELKERAALSFERLGMLDTEVEAKTFHALGLAIIGEATGRRLSVPKWARDPAKGLRKMTELVDQLKDRSPEFRSQWDMFRLVFGRDLPPLGAEMMADGYGTDGKPYLRTLKGDRVQSMEECVIADWLFYNGVTYEYERPYEFDTATATHRQYHPDFYYPEAALYHEHLALDARGQAPEHFRGYMQSLDWKRQEHERRGTALFETTSYGLRSGQALGLLAAKLTESGIELDPNPDRPLPSDGAKPMPDDDLAGLMRTFIAHAKSNCLTMRDLSERLHRMPEDHFKERHRRFLEIAGPVFEAWDTALADEKAIDFEDMLNMAASLLEQGRFQPPYDLVMADEFQDASRARARLCRALVSQPGKYLFAVGDDWQSINRFAGADVSVMTGFREFFGHGQVLKLEETFRCPQELCDVSSRFVVKNPAQIPKRVRSDKLAQGPVLQAFQVAHRDLIQDGIRDYLSALHAKLLSGELPLGREGKVSVFVLGRYKKDKSTVPSDWEAAFGETMEVKFLTAHKSKGSEADYVILPGMVHRGFPNLRSDDPLLSLVMPAEDPYPLGEERRLFYVALTRARRTVAMFSVRGKQSAFLDELVKEGAVQVTTLAGAAVKDERCPVCKVGVFVDRNGPHGPFKSCSSYPLCHNKPKRSSGAKQLSR
ncbi:UvrD-helicase domain-containing protein [Xanthomonas sacchari]|uniref:UvrD-helicase domain-containing protein n=1 Tax=Xanthomonas sacchari TaxID=56458 RepID=UPI0022554CE3|nr:UvrD-helicase domain-containing protein [Xanthomonas sacchari]MCW0462945.1 ATP-dependent DNA helicase Rep [Xanthomonas sacchari]